MPTFVYASKEDHIVPWKSAYASAQLLTGDVTFVLGASGHIAGVINPPAKNKRNYWTNDALDAEPEGWLDGAEKVPGSWWPAWYAWLAPQSGTQTDAPTRAGERRVHPDRGGPGRVRAGEGEPLTPESRRRGSTVSRARGLGASAAGEGQRARRDAQQLAQRELRGVVGLTAVHVAGRVGGQQQPQAGREPPADRQQ